MLGALVALALGPNGVSAQIPDEFTNLQFLPEDISRADLLVVMRDFSFALDVRCQYCHVGGDGVSFEGVDFPSDDGPNKRKARFMLQMVADLNSRLDADLPDRRDPQVQVQCKTCHRGLPRPTSLAFTLRETLDSFGTDSISVVYDRLREGVQFGKYNFGEWEVNVLAENLQAEERYNDAVAILSLNSLHYPQSASIQFNLGRLMELQDDPAGAIRYYERVLELRAGHRGATGRLQALRGG